MHDGELVNDARVQIALSMLNRHGLIAGATGTGKTKTLQLLAGQLSKAGVPVFVADIKGDLTGLAAPGDATNPKVIERVTSLGWTFEPSGHPVEFLSLSGKLGAQVRATVHSFGPLLLGKVLDLNDTQTSILALIFKYCDDNDLPLLDLKDLTATLKYLASDEGKPILADYGGMSSASVGVLLRSIVVLEQEGADVFFGEPEFEVDDLLRTTPEGEGIISILELSDVMDQPRLFSTFMLWMLAQLYESLPEAGDLPKPKLCFFFDEAHLLFDDASQALLDQIERTARLIRSKGVGVYFVTQAPTDVPSPVLAQLGNRVQHALRAFTPDDADALRKTARTFPTTEFYDVEKTITSLGTGEALVTVLSPEGCSDAARRDPPAGARFAHGAARRRPVPGPDRDQPVPGQVRRDGRPRQRLRADHGQDRGGPRGIGRGGDGCSRPGRRRPDDRDRAEHDDAGPAAARDPAPGARDGRRPEGRRARAQGAGEGPARRRQGPAEDDRQRDPDRRPGGDLARRPGPHPGRVRDPVRRGQGPLIPTGRRTWLDPGWQAEARAWVEAELAAVDRRVSGPIEQPHVTPWSTAMRIPTDGRSGLVQGVGARDGARRTVAGGVPAARRRAGRAARSPSTRAGRGCCSTTPGRPSGPTRPDGLGDHDLGAWERILPEYAALQRSVEGAVAVAAMAGAGVPDGRPGTLARELDRLLDDDRVWGLVAARRAGRRRGRASAAACRRATDPRRRRASWTRPASRTRSSTTTCTAGTSSSARPAIGSSTGATRSSRTRSRRST